MGYTFIFPHNKECKIFLQIISNKETCAYSWNNYSYSL